MRCAECRDALTSYVDGELMPEEAETMRDHLASCAACAAEHEMLQSLSRRLREGLARPRAPDVLKARIRSALSQSTGVLADVTTPGRPWTGLLVAGALIAVVSGGASFAVARREASRPAIAEQVLSSHLRSLMPGHLTDVASNDSHNVKPWFNGRVDLSPLVPRLDSAGFPLAGGRLDYVGGRTVATVVYVRRQHVINVFSWPTEDRTAHTPVTSIEKGYHVVHWSDGGVELWVASDLNARELEQFVTLYRRE